MKALASLDFAKKTNKQKNQIALKMTKISCHQPVQAVRLESAWSDRVRYMVVVYTSGRQDTEENILLGIDFTSKDW